MDQTSRSEKKGQNVLDFKCKKILHGEETSATFVQKPGTVGDRNLEVNFVSQTPEKANKPLHTKLKESGVEHLEKYKNMVELFDSMICSLRLLSLCKKSPAFRYIASQVEILTKRKFSCKHLAQIKYLLPEAIQIDKILVHDKKSLFMKPDLKIALLFDVIEAHSQHSDFIALSQAFACRLINFFTVHPEACEIPEATLPEPFGQGSQTTLGDKAAEIPQLLESVCTKSQTIPLYQSPTLGDKAAEVPEVLDTVCTKSQTIALEQSPADSLKPFLTSDSTETLTRPSLLPQSFSRHFSEKSGAPEMEKVNFLQSLAPSQSSTTSDNLNNQVVKTYQSEECPGDCATDKDINSLQQINLRDASLRSIVKPHLQLTSSRCESPQQKLSLSVDSLTIETPAQVTPKRSVPSCDNKPEATTIHTSTSCYNPAKRFLDFSHLEGDKSALDSLRVGKDKYNVLHDGITQVDSKGFFGEGNVIFSSASLEKAEGSCGNPTGAHITSEPDFAANTDESIGLPALVALIHRIFQSTNCSSITEHELVHKIIMNYFDITERREVEEQIKLLEKLVPDWICRKVEPSGDTIYKINRVTDLASVQGRVINT